MSNIEEDIKKLKARFLNINWIYGNTLGITRSQYEDIKGLINNILAEQETNKQKIKELEEENLRLKGRIDVTNWQEKTVYESLKEKYIPVQKVKEILDKAEVMDYYTLPNVIEDLEKLLEDK